MSVPNSSDDAEYVADELVISMSSEAAAKERLEALFNPSSVAVIGASDDPGKISGKPLAYLTRYGFGGRLYVVNPRRQAVSGVTSYPTVGELPESPDLALIMLPARHVIAAAQACAARGAKACVVFANGFADSGRHDLQLELQDIVRASGMRLLGPNCLGLVNIQNAITASFSSILEYGLPPSGKLALVTQSGSMGNGILLEFQMRGLGISKWVATGNEADVDVIDVVDYLVGDENSQIIAVFAEAFRQGWRWAEVARRARNRSKAIVILKAGSGRRSAEAVASHTGKIVGSHQAWEDVASIEQLLTVENMDEFCDAVEALSLCPRSTGGFAVVGTGGGGVLAMDECDRRGLPVATFSQRSTQVLQSTLPPAASVENPVDPTPTSDAAWSSACATVVKDPNVGVLLVVISSLKRPYLETCELLQDTFDEARLRGKAVCLTYLAPSVPMDDDLREQLRSAGVLVMPSIARAVSALAVLSRYVVSSRAKDSSKPSGGVAALGSGSAPDNSRSHAEFQGILALREPLRTWGVAVVESIPIESVEVATTLMGKWQRGLVLKLEDSRVSHKTEQRLVRTGISDVQGVVDAFGSLRSLAVSEDAVVVAQPFVGPGLEVLVACTEHPELGPTITVGAGGTFAELLSDTCSFLAPVTLDVAVKLIQRTRIGRLLQGYRGGQRYDIDALAELMAAVSRCFVENGSWAELELNPVVVLPGHDGALAVDALGVLASEAASRAQLLTARECVK